MMALPNLNLMLILVSELTSFLEVHNQDLLKCKDSLKHSLQPFFHNHIFPLATTWIRNISEAAVQESQSFLSVKIAPYNQLSDDQILDIKKLIKRFP